MTNKPNTQTEGKIIKEKCKCIADYKASLIRKIVGMKKDDRKEITEWLDKNRDWVEGYNQAISNILNEIKGDNFEVVNGRYYCKKHEAKNCIICSGQF